jgi:hypothetical protein
MYEKHRGYSYRDHRRNEDILEHKADPVEQKLAQYSRNCRIMLGG